MVPTYNGWDDTPEDEREELEQWESDGSPRRRRSSQKILGPIIEEGVSGEGRA